MDMRRFITFFAVFLLSLPIFAKQIIAPLWEEFDTQTEKGSRSSCISSLDTMISSLDSMLSDSSFLYVRDQNPELFALVSNLRDLTFSTLTLISDSALSDSEALSLMADKKHEMEHIVFDILLNERKIADTAQFLYSILVILLSFLGILLLFFVLLYFSRQKRVMELEKTVESERLITKTIVQVQENERTRIYRDLHDTVAQDIKALNLFASQLTALPEQNVETKELFSNIEFLGKRMIDEIYVVIKNLTPPELHENYISSIEDLCQNMTNLTKIPCKYLIEPKITDKLLDLSENQKLHIYRIIQESLNNAIKHASPTECSLLITGQDNFIDIFVTDDGKGFESLSGKITQNTFGIKGMMSRANAIGAKLVVDSTEESGTEIKLTIPIQNKSAGGANKWINLMTFLVEFLQGERWSSSLRWEFSQAF